MHSFTTQKQGLLTTLFVSCLIVLTLSTVTPTHAAINPEINYQGKLTNASNVAVADGTYNMRFWLLTSPTIATTSAIWTESLTSTNKVQVTNGLFSVMLGSTSPLTGVDFNQTLYLGVEVGGTSTPGWDGEMSPRKILGTVPSAFFASTSQNAVTVGGVASTSFLRSDQADTASSLLTFTGGIIANSSSTITNLTTSISTTTILVINNSPFTSLTGTGLTNTGGVLTASLGTDIAAGEIANGDHGFFSYSSGSASLDTGGLTSLNLLTALTNETGTDNAVFSTNPLLTGFRSFASSTIGDGTGAGGLTVLGNSTTTGTLTVSGAGNSSFVGNVGIGTTSPSARLHVLSSGSSVARFDRGSNLMGFEGSSGASGGFGLYDYAASAFQWYAKAGNVGIGTTDPSTAKLHIASTDTTLLWEDSDAGVNEKGYSWRNASGIFKLQLNGDSFASVGDLAIALDRTGSSLDYIEFPNGDFRVGSGGSRMFINESTGNVGIGTTSPYSLLSLSNNLNTAADTPLFTIASTTGGTATSTLMTVLANGNVGIGTAAPAYPLDINGNVRTGNIYAGVVYTSNVQNNGYQTSPLSFDVISGQNMYFKEGGATKMTLLTGGNVGIGTTSPSSRLSVVGTAGGTSPIFTVASSTGSTSLAVLANGDVEMPNNVITAGTKWTTRTSATTTGNTLGSITYGNGIFVAVAYAGSNRIITSSDGVTWTARTPAQVSSWLGVTYGNGLFVAVSSDGTNRVMTSPDGINWTSRTAAEANTWNSVAYGNGVFVAIAWTGTNRVMTSPDGINWTARSVAANTWNSITYGNGVFVAVGSTGAVMTSPDGINWTSRTAAEANTWISVTYGNGLFVAVSGSGTNQVMTSPDGINWTARSVVTSAWSSVAYGTGIFSVVGTDSSVMTSPDGINWTARSALPGNWLGITHGNGLFVAVSSDGFVMTSGKSFTNALAHNNIYQGGMSVLGGAFNIGTTTFASTSPYTANILNVASTTGTSLLTMNTNGYLGLGSTTPSRLLTVSGDAIMANLTATGTLTVSGNTTLTYASTTGLTATNLKLSAVRDSANSLGTNGMILQTNGATAQWVATSTLGFSDSGISGGQDGYVTRWLSATTFGTSSVLDNGTVTGINATSSLYSFNVQARAGTSPFNVASSSGSSLLSVTQAGHLLVGTTTSSTILGNILIGTTTLIGSTESPTALRAVGNIDNTASVLSSPRTVSSVAVGSTPSSIYVSGRYAYVANSGASTMSIIDISNPNSSSVISTTTTGTSPVSIHVSGRYAYVANSGANTVSIIDISNPASPTTISSPNIGSQPRFLQVSGRYLYVVTNLNTMVVLDVSNPSLPVVVSSTATGLWPYSIYISGHYAYVANNHVSANTMSVFDISNPASPANVSTPSTGSQPRSIYVSGRYAYVANSGANTVSIIDISNPASPTTISTTPTGGTPRSIYVSGRYAYVANSGESTMSVIDISNPASPVSVSTPSTGTGPVSVHVSGRYAYVANSGASTVSIIDIGGLESTSAIVHSLEAGNFAVRNDIDVGGGINVIGSITVGNGGLNIMGNSSLSSTTISFLTASSSIFTNSSSTNFFTRFASTTALTVSGQTYLGFASTTGLTATNLKISALRDSANSLGTNGMVLQTNGTASTWVATSTLGFLSTSSIGVAVQAYDAELLDIADGTFATDFVNTANPWADNEVADILTISGGTLSSNTITNGSSWTNINLSITGTTTLTYASTTGLTATNLKLSALRDSANSLGTNGMVLQTNGSTAQWVATSTLGFGTGSGSVTSVDMSVPTGLSISGNPITTSGTLALALTAGYAIPTTTRLAELDGKVSTSSLTAWAGSSNITTLGTIAAFNATNGTSTTFRATTLGVGSDYITDITGAGLTNTAGVLTLNATGDWTGTLDTYDGSAFGVLSEAETIAGNWVNTANPWAVNEGGTGVSTLSAGELLLGNGTGAITSTTTTGLRNTMGLVIGSTIQAYDADLTTYAGITPSANIQTLLGSADYAAARTNLSLTVGTNVQAWDTQLDDVADGTFATDFVNTANPWVVNEGGTGAATFTTNGVLYGSTTNPLMATAAGTNGQLLVANTTGVPTFVTMGTDATLSATGALTIADNAVDGTDIAIGSDATGDIMYYNGTDWTRLAGSSGILRSTGAAAPSWVATSSLNIAAANIVGLGSLATLSTINDSNWSGTDLTVANGGTGVSTLSAGEILVGNGTGAITSTTTANLKASLGLNLVENTALSTWAGSGNLTTTGALNSGSITSGFGAIDIGGDSITAGSLLVSANDAGALGAFGTAWSDLFLASGGVINWSIGDVTMTHSANTLAFAGASSGYSFDNNVIVTGIASSTYASTTALTVSGNSYLGTTTISGGLTMSGTASNIILGSNYLSGDGGDEGVYVAADGNVGIGTNNPQMGLHIEDKNFEIRGGSGAVQRIYLQGNSSYPHIELFGNGITKAKINTSGNSYFNGGNLGIGSTTPSRLLTVAGDVIMANLTATGTLTVSGNTTLASATSTSLYTTTLGVGSDYITDFTGSGLSVTNGVLSASGGGASNWLYQSGRLTPSTTVGIGIFASSTIGDGTATGGLTISGGATTTGNAYFAGNVGIGTTSPSSKLSLQGGSFFQVGGTGSQNYTPTTVGQVALGAVGNDVYISGRYAYVVTNTKAGDDFLIYDVSTATPSFVGGADIEASGLSIFVSGSYAYLTTASNASGNEFRIYDISNPSAPRYVGGTDLQISGRDVFVSGRYAYVVKSSGGITNDFIIYDISNPASPVAVGGIDVGTTVYDVYALGRYAYIVTSPVAGNDFRIYDISNPSLPAEVGGADLVGGGSRLQISGNYAYTISSSVTGSELQVFDISDPASPVLTTTKSITYGGRDIFVAGRYAYVTGSTDSGSGPEFMVYDISNPYSLTYLGGVNLGAHGWAVKVSGRYAYVVTNSGSTNFIVYDISGADIQSALVHSLEVGDLQVRNNISTNGQLSVTGGIGIGQGGLYSNGAGSFTTSATTSLAGISALSATTLDNNTSANADVLTLTHAGWSTTTPGANGISTGLLFAAGNTSGTTTDIGRIAAIFTAAGGTATTSALTFSTLSGSSLSERMRIDSAGNVGIGTSTPGALLNLDKRSLTGSVVGGMKQYLSFANSTLSAVYYGDESYFVNAPTATSTFVGKMIRVEDTSVLGNTVRGLEVQAHRGTNTSGENTALSGFARTFGVSGTTFGDAGETYLPAGVFAETRGTTQGNALRAYSGTITTEDLVSLFHDTSNFTGTGLSMNFGNAGGTFTSTSTAKFLDFQVGGTSKFTVTAQGTTTIGDGTTTYKAGLQIGYGGLCVDNDGSCTASTTGRITSVSSASGNSDLAEMYFSSQELEAGEIVALTGGLSMERASEESSQNIIGVISTKPGLIMGFDDVSLTAGEGAYPVALKGRVPIKLSTENGPVVKGDRIALSSIPGVGMKANDGDVVVGIALEDYTGEYAYSPAYLNQFGDDLVKRKMRPLNQETDTRTQDGCSYGGGSAQGEAQCVKDRVKPIKPVTVSVDTKTSALNELKSEVAEVAYTKDGEEVTIGQAIMFVHLHDFIAQSSRDILTELSATSSVLNGNGTETLWSRVKELAQNFVDGVLRVAGIKTDELCVGDVCVNEATFLRMVENAGGAQASGDTSTGTGSVDTMIGGGGSAVDSGGSSPESTPVVEAQSPVLEDPAPTAETPVEEPPVETLSEEPTPSDPEPTAPSSEPTPVQEEVPSDPAPTPVPEATPEPPVI